jgi:hypothetical protein
MSDFRSLSSRTIKVSHNGEARRGKLIVPVGATSAEAFQAIRTTVATLFGTSPDSILLKYLDEEGDLCTLCEHSVADLVCLSPEGILRLTLETREPAATLQNEASESKPIDAGHRSCPLASDAVAGASASADDTDDKLRSRIRTLLLKIPVGVRGLVINVVQGMDPSALHGMVRMFMDQKAAHANQFRTHANAVGEVAQQHMKEVEEVLPQLVSMEPDTLKALVLEELQSMSTAAGTSTEGVGGPQQVNPLEAMLGGLLGGAGMQANDATPQQNPLGQIIGAALSAAGGGMGKGAGYAQGGAPEGNPWANGAGFPQMGKGAGFRKGGVPGGNPWEAMFQNSFASNAGVGAPGGQMPNPMQQMFAAMLAGKGVGKGNCSWPGGMSPQNGNTAAGNEAKCTKCSAGHPLQKELRSNAVCDICGKAGTSFRCYSGCDWDACDQCGIEASPSVAETVAAASTNAPLDPHLSASDANSSSRAAFEESVNDLVSMGLVSDPQVARELLTAHGDMSTVVSILTDG